MRGEPLPCPYARHPGRNLHKMVPARDEGDPDAEYQWKVKTKWRLPLPPLPPTAYLATLRSLPGGILVDGVEDAPLDGRPWKPPADAQEYVQGPTLARICGGVRLMRCITCKARPLVGVLRNGEVWQVVHLERGA